jgi:hypothetical protein
VSVRAVGRHLLQLLLPLPPPQPGTPPSIDGKQKRRIWDFTLRFTIQEIKLVSYMFVYVYIYIFQLKKF